MSDNPFRHLPAVNDLLQLPIIRSLTQSHAHEQIVGAIRSVLDDVRRRLGKGESVDGTDDLARRIAQHLSTDLRPRLRPVINATGIVLHTNIGRAPIAVEVAEAAAKAASGYLNLELDLETGKRSSRQDAIREWVCRLIGAENATAVNNNAAATVIVLRAICQGREVVISRGQLVEIGGSFRIPDIMSVSGAILHEVGATNITRLADYEKAIGPNTAALLRVHCSNYRIHGHTESVGIEELVSLGKKHQLPVIDDIGSGALLDFARFGLHDEPLARHSIAAGADLVLFSGDKLLGGPQAGIIAGQADLIGKIEKDPLMRAFRLDKMTLAALESTLRIYLNEERALREVPVLRMLNTPMAELQQRAESLAGRLRQVPGLKTATVANDSAFVGGGSLPDQRMPTCVIEVEAADLSDSVLAYRLRTGSPAVLGRLRDSRLVLDVRTIFAEEEAGLIDAMQAALAPGGSSS